MKRRVGLWFASVLVLSFCGQIGQAFAQGTLLQGGPWTPGHAPMYVGSGNGQAVVQDSGPAGGGGIGLGLAEQLLVARGTGGAVAPFANAGTGPLSTNWCDYDAPLTNATGYHYLCFSPNAQGGGLLAYGAGGSATALPFVFNINGVPYTIAGSGLTVGATTLAGAFPPRFTNGVLFDQGGVLEEYPVTGTLNAVLSNSPTLTGLPTVQGLTTTQPGWYAQITGDANARVRVGLNSTDIPGLAFGPGSGGLDAFLERAAAATFRFGGPDKAAPAAQTLGVQNVVAGTSNTAGTAWTFNDSGGTGTALSGGYLFKTHPAGSSGSTQNAAVTALSIFGDGGLSTGAAADQGAGTLNLAGSLYNNGTAPIGTGGYVRGTSPTLVNPTVTGTLNINGNSHGGSEGLLTALDGSMVSTNSVVMTLGLDNSNANNSMNFSFSYSSTGSVNNHGCLGLFGDNQIACWDGNHNFGVNTGTNVLDKAFTVISDSNFYVDSGGSVGLINIVGLSGALTLTAASTQSIELVSNSALLLYDGTELFGFVDGGLKLGTSGKRWLEAHAEGVFASGTGYGYDTGKGAGCAISQGTSRTQGVTCNGVTGAITLFSAAGTSTPATFTVTDSSVAANDTISCSQASGANSYRCYITGITAATSFKITQEASVGTASEAPVFNFNIIHGTIN